MAGLLDSFLPEDEVKRNAALQGALSAGLGIMTNAYNPGGRFGPAIGAGGLQGLQAYQEAIQNANANQIRQMQIDEMKRQQSQRVKQEQALATAPREIQEAVALGVPVSEIWKRNNPERKWVEGFDAQGRPVKGFFDGSNFVPVGGSQAKPVEWKDVGGKLVATDPYTGMPIQNVEMGKSLSPGELASNRLGWANYGLGVANFNKPSIQNVEGLGMFQVGPSGQATPVMAGGKPIVATKPLTESQGTSALFGTRASESNRILNELADKNIEQPGVIKRVVEAAPIVGDTLGTLANWTQSAGQQKVEQAQRDFINAILRRESGAVISPQEFDNAKKQYFPQVGDSDEVKAQKKANRETAIRGLSVMAGPAGNFSAQSGGNQDLAAAAAAELERRKGGRK